MYRPPEMVDPYLKWKVDDRVDLWMLGCVAYTLVYGRHPFVDCSKIGIVEAAVNYPRHKSPKKI
jgi:AP2-associated kinase